MENYGIESLIYIPIDNDNSWCGLDKSGVVRIIKYDYDLGYKAIVTNLKESKQLFENYALNQDSGFAYDAQHNVFIFTDSTKKINAKTGIILASKIDVLSTEVYFASYIGSELVIVNDTADESDVKNYLQGHWLKQSIPSEDAISQKTLYLLDKLLSNNKVIIKIDTRDFDIAKLIRECLYMLPPEYANKLSFNTNAGEKILNAVFDTSIMCATKVEKIPSRVQGSLINESTLIAIEQYEPNSAYCRLLRTIGRVSTINEIMTSRNTKSSDWSLAALEERAKQVIVEKQRDIVIKKVSEINKVCRGKEAKKSNNLFEDLLKETDILLHQKGEREALLTLTTLGEGWTDSNIKQKGEEAKGFLSSTFGRINKEDLLAYFADINCLNDAFVQGIIVPWGYAQIKNREKEFFESWSRGLDTIKKSSWQHYDCAKKICCSIFSLYYSNISFPTEWDKEHESTNAWIFRVGKIFDYCDESFNSLINNFERHRTNYAKQQSYLRKFAIEKKGRRSTQNKTKKNSDVGVEFSVGLNFPIIVSIVLPALFLSGVTFLLLYCWAIDLEQIYISMQIVPLSALMGAIFISIAMGFICITIGLVIRIIHEHISSNPPPKVVWLRVLITELVFSLTICLLLLTVNILIII